ncbi:MAG: c-type cytochrome [Parvularculaceae bacterium]|nr:c-type cytochrome [Parvularculaceae bacterium]
MRHVRYALAAAALALAACGGASDEAATRPSAAASGERVFSQCAVCHTAAPPDQPAAKMRLIGPPLFGVVGRPAASVPGFKYSRAMQASGLVWDEATLDAFLENPHKLVPGTTMSFAGEADAARRAALIAHLKTLK